LLVDSTEETLRQEVLALRELLAGMFKVFRNKYGHQDVEVPQEEALTVLWMINYALGTLPKYKIRRSRKLPNRRTKRPDINSV
jgi:hypothetical protein